VHVRARHALDRQVLARAKTVIAEDDQRVSRVMIGMDRDGLVVQ